MRRTLRLLIAAIALCQISCTYQERSGGDYSYSRIRFSSSE